MDGLGYPFTRLQRMTLEPVPLRPDLAYRTVGNPGKLVQVGTGAGVDGLDRQGLDVGVCGVEDHEARPVFARVHCLDATVQLDALVWPVIMMDTGHRHCRIDPLHEFANICSEQKIVVTENAKPLVPVQKRRQEPGIGELGGGQRIDSAAIESRLDQFPEVEFSDSDRDTSVSFDCESAHIGDFRYLSIRSDIDVDWLLGHGTDLTRI